jgi:hypothetical protein
MHITSVPQCPGSKGDMQLSPAASAPCRIAAVLHQQLQGNTPLLTYLPKAAQTAAAAAVSAVEVPPLGSSCQCVAAAAPSPGCQPLPTPSWLSSTACEAQVLSQLILNAKSPGQQQQQQQHLLHAVVRLPRMDGNIMLGTARASVHHLHVTLVCIIHIYIYIYI